jgi:hypothetical protein
MLNYASAFATAKHQTPAATIDLTSVDPDLMRQIEPALEGELVQSLLIQPLAKGDKVGQVCRHMHVVFCMHTQCTYIGLARTVYIRRVCMVLGAGMDRYIRRIFMVLASPTHTQTYVYTYIHKHTSSTYK